jgi:hypothetical protein
LSEQIRNLESIKQREQTAIDARLARGEVSQDRAERARAELDRKIQADKDKVTQALAVLEQRKAEGEEKARTGVRNDRKELDKALHENLMNLSEPGKREEDDIRRKALMDNYKTDLQEIYDFHKVPRPASAAAPTPQRVVSFPKG